MDTLKMSSIKCLVQLLVVIQTLMLTDAVISSGSSRCPDRCRCRHAEVDTSVIVDCSNSGFQEIPTDLPADTVYLDLSGNHLRNLKADSFPGVVFLSTILLNDNWISEIEPNAFRGLQGIQMLDLRRNTLTTLPGNSMARLTGATNCLNDNLCPVLLQENPLTSIESYAFSWCQGISIMLGNSSRELTIEAYAFYGAENIHHIEISDLPSLSVEPRVFTNTDMVKYLEVKNTHLTSLQKFTFEGLKNVEQMHFQNCYFRVIEEFAFSGIIYAPDESRSTLIRTGTDHNGGGLLNISHSVLPPIPTDTFRDTNLKTLALFNNHIDVIEEFAFRGLHQLDLLELAGNKIGYVKSQAFGGLKNVAHVKLSQNAMGSLEEHAFRDSQGIDMLSLHLRPNSNLTLGSFSFSGLRDVGVLEIKGAPGSIFRVAEDAFHDLGGVQILRITNVSLPTLKQHIFRGLSKVQTIQLSYCNISKIDSTAFGEARISGAIATVEVKDGNNLSCDCETNKLLRDFESRFSKFTIVCYTSTSEPRMLTADTLDWPSCLPAGGNSLKTNISLSLLTLVFLFVWHKHDYL